jgi:hypothetical protein
VLSLADPQPRLPGNVPLSLHEWDTFYVITGSAGAALTGLMFVVIALAADRVDGSASDGVGAFSTPTVGHFAIVLLIAGIITIPLHRVLSLSVCLGGCAVGGITSGVRAAVRMRRIEGYSAETEDWTWHVILPLAAYAVLLVGALVLPSSLELALVVVAAVVLMLLFIGIHNAWDVAVYLVTQHATRRGAGDAPAAAPPATVTPAPPVAPPPAAAAEGDRPDFVRSG